MCPRVSVPVLSEHTMVAAPIVSQAASSRTSAWSAAILRVV